MTTYPILTDKQKKRYERILKLAEELMISNGFHKLSLSDLTGNLRISRSTIYDYFGSKEGLIEIVVKRYNERLNEGLDDIIANTEISTYDKFLAISNQLAKNSPLRTMYKFHKDLKIHLPDLYDLYRQGRADRVDRIYRPLINEGLANGMFDKSLPIDFLLQTYLKSSQMVCETDMMENSNISKIEAMDKVTRIFLNGAKKL